MKKDKVMDNKLIALWEQVLEFKMRDLKYYKKTNNDFMIDLTKDSLKGMLNDYQRVKAKYKTS